MPIDIKIFFPFNTAKVYKLWQTSIFYLLSLQTNKINIVYISSKTKQNKYCTARQVRFIDSLLYSFIHCSLKLFIDTPC